MTDELQKFKLDFASVMAKLARAYQNGDPVVLETYEVEALIKALKAMIDPGK